jgi:hypothetical protein
MSLPESILLGKNEDFLAHPPPLGNGKFSCQSSCILHPHTAAGTLATQKMWQPIEHLAIIAAGHATRGCHGHHRADHRCCSDQAFRESKHQRAKPARGRAASRGCCFAPRSGVGAWRWTERHDGRPQRVTAAALQPLTRTLISLQPLLGFWSRARAALRCTGPALLLLLFVGDAGGARARARVAWRGVARS